MAEYIESTITDRERLIALIIEAKRTDPEIESFSEYLTDYLLEHGVILPPCKVGDTVYQTDVKHGSWIKEKNRKACTECGFVYYDNGISFKFCPDCGAKMDGKW